MLTVCKTRPIFPFWSYRYDSGETSSTPPKKRNQREKDLMFCDTPETLFGFSFWISFPENDTKKLIRHKVDYFFFNCLPSCWKPLKLCPSPQPTTNLLPLQSPSPPTNTPFAPVPCVPPPPAASSGVMPRQPDPGRDSHLTQQPRTSWRHHTGSPWKKTDGSDWGCGLRAQLTWVGPVLLWSL